MPLPISAEALAERLLPPSEHRHAALTLRELRALVTYVDDRQPFMYNGEAYQVASRKLVPGVYRAWFEVRR